MDENGNYVGRVGKDHTNFLMLLGGLITLLALVFILGLRTTYKRTVANRARETAEKP